MAVASHHYSGVWDKKRRSVCLGRMTRVDIESATIQEVAIDQLVLSPDYQLREKLEAWKVEEYAAVFDRLPPVLVACVQDKLYLLDGLHRRAAANQLGRTRLRARIVEAGADSAFALAVRSNAAHGLPLKTKEKKAAARGMLIRFPERSDRWIAEDVGLSHPTVTGLRAELETGGKICHLGYSLGQDGKRYGCDCPRCRPPALPAAKVLGAPASQCVAMAGVIDEASERLSVLCDGTGDAHAAPRRSNIDARDPYPPAPILTFSLQRGTAASAEGAGLHGPLPTPQSRRDAVGDPSGCRTAEEGAPVGPSVAVRPALAWPSLPLRVGPVTIWHGDARDLAGWGIAPVQLVVTSPPYNVGIAYGRHCDTLAQEAYWGLLSAAWRACFSVMARGARIAVIVPFGVGRNPWVPLAARVAELLTEAGFTLRGQLVWDKGTSGGRTTWGSFRLPTDPSLRDTTEAILVAHKGESHLPLPPDVTRHDSEGPYSPFLADQALFMELAQDHWTVPPESAARVGHPAPFPVALAERLIRFYAYPGAHILDPFAGSGSTGLAALRLGCQATLVDIDADYCSLAEERCRRILTQGEADAPAA
jgi:DNA modification methylase